MKLAIKIKLSVMMFLEFFIWGAWFVTLGTYLFSNLKTNAIDISAAYLTQSIGAIVAPFIIGLIADRFFAAQKILGILHLAGAVLLWLSSTAPDFSSFYPYVLLYMIVYMPTLALVNSISFRQMQDPGKEFPPIRILGTLGWIIAGFTIGWLGWEKSGTLDLTFKTAAIASAILGVFSFTLPDTPPLKKGTRTSVSEILGLDAIGLLKNNSYRIFFLASVAICIPLAFYYNFTNAFLNEVGMQSAAGKQAFGQVSELLFMALMPFFFIKLGVKKMLAVGMFAWVLRYLFFAYGDAGSNYWMLIAGIVLHGICYDFFFVTGQIYTDRLAGDQFKSAAQGFITLATYGVGMLFGFLLSGGIVDRHKTGESSHDWTQIWLIPAGIAAAVLVVFLLLFRNQPGTKGSPAENTGKQNELLPEL